jgi:crotonobetainyl-CoA:carnitine CoA-transferase CaiB-like acyl-CoA transferase
MASGLQMTQGILLALLERERSGHWTTVQVKMQDAAMFMMRSTPRR